MNTFLELKKISIIVQARLYQTPITLTYDKNSFK